jgi:hypothetical protein
MGTMWTLGLNADAVRAATWRKRVGRGVTKQRSGGEAYQGFTLLHVFLSEQKLTVQVRKVDGVEIKQGDMPESGKYDVLDLKNNQSPVVRKVHSVEQDTHTKLAADTAGSYYEGLHFG